jgi:hypothetical protein
MTETTPRGVPTSALDLIDSATGKKFSKKGKARLASFAA